MRALKPYAVTFRHPEGRLVTWTRFAVDMESAIAEARAVLRAEFPDGLGGSHAMLKRVADTSPVRSPLLVRLGHASALYVAFCLAFALTRGVTP